MTLLPILCPLYITHPHKIPGYQLEQLSRKMTSLDQVMKFKDDLYGQSEPLENLSCDDSLRIIKRNYFSARSYRRAAI